MPERPAFTVLMPNHDYARFLPGAIASVRAQTFPDFELLVVDDGSRDRSREIIARAARGDGRIRLLTHPGAARRGILKSYELGLAHAAGRWCAFLEPDDLWHPRNLEKKAAALAAEPRASAVFSAYVPFGEPLGSLYWKLYAAANRSAAGAGLVDLFPALLRRNPVASFSHFAAPTDLLRVIPPGGIAKSHDWWVLGHLSLRGPFFGLRERLSFWRIHRASASYGGVRRATLARLFHFLRAYYGSLLQEAGRRQDAEKIRRLEAALGFLELVRTGSRLKTAQKILAHPLEGLRFASYVVLKNLAFLGGARA